MAPSSREPTVNERATPLRQIPAPHDVTSPPLVSAFLRGSLQIGSTPSDPGKHSPDVTPSVVPRLCTRSASIYRVLTAPIRHSEVKPSAHRTRDHTIRTRRAPSRASDAVLLLAGKSVSDTRSGVLGPHIGDADVNMVDFRSKIGRSARNLPMHTKRTGASRSARLAASVEHAHRIATMFERPIDVT